MLSCRIGDFMYIAVKVPGNVELDGMFPGFTEVHRGGMTYVTSPYLGTFEEKSNADRIRGLVRALRNYFNGMPVEVSPILYPGRPFAFAVA